MRKILIAVCCGLMFLGCNKSDDTPSGGNVYHIKGKLIKDCSGTPMSHYAIRLLSGTTTIARDTTDANGNFDITCDTLTFDVMAVHDTIGATSDYMIRRQFTGMRFGNTYDWGTINKSWVTRALFKITVTDATAMPDGNLYVAMPFSTPQIYAVSAGNQTIIDWFVYGSGYEDFQMNSHYRLYWGCTRQELDSVINLSPANDMYRSPYHLLTAPYKLCGLADTVYVTLP